MSRRLRIVRDHDDDFIVDLLPSAPRIEPVQYEAKTVDLIMFWYRHYWVARFEFAVYDCPATHGRVLCHLFAYYRVGSPISPRSHLGQFFDLLGRRPTRTNPDLRVLLHKVWVVKVRDDKSGRYSVIDKVVERIA